MRVGCMGVVMGAVVMQALCQGRYQGLELIGCEGDGEGRSHITGITGRPPLGGEAHMDAFAGREHRQHLHAVAEILRGTES